MEKKPWVHVVKRELDGVRRVLEWIRELPLSKRCVPKDILDPDALIHDAEVRHSYNIMPPYR